ncbi:hypothetical protein B0J14DRAFT_608024 [Halenospora varia]|nr:hypothetical protein B0J14DRAFT_608024 [Halenospora varia]
MAPNTNGWFIRRCKVNYYGSDFSRSTTQSLAECMALCVKNNLDPSSATFFYAVTWVYGGPQGTYANYCWLKDKVPATISYDMMESAMLVLSTQLLRRGSETLLMRMHSLTSKTWLLTNNRAKDRVEG